MFGLVILSTIVCFLVGLIGQFVKPIDDRGSVIKWAILSLVGNFVMNFIIVYLFMPAMTGPLLGLDFLWAPLLINAIVSGIVWWIKSESYNEITPKKGECVGSLSGLVLLGIIALFIAIGANWGDPNAKLKANYLPIVQASADTFPSTDPDHAVLVQGAVVDTVGSRALTESGQNLGAIYKTGSYTLQNVAGHLYWVAPLVYKNLFANLSNYNSPGLVVVDAEDPNVKAILKMDHPLHYFPSAIFNQDLVRHVYLNGYASYRLLDATMEIDDDWVPHFTLDASKYFIGLTGAKVEKILVINSETGAIQAYDLKDSPAWVDRALPYDVIDDYVNWYGRWSKAPFWFWDNWQRANIETPADDHPALAYSSVDSSPVYQFVMSSENSTDHASTGVILVDTNKLQATRYPIYGIAVGSHVNSAFADTEANKVNKYPNTTPILINVYDHLTWFTVYNSSLEDGATFVGVGLMDANKAGASNVIWAETKEEALARYHQWLTNHPSNTTEVSQTATEMKIEGTIAMIVPEVQNGATLYFFYIAGNKDMANTVFSGIADLQTAELRFARVGDQVKVTYMISDDGTASVSQFDDLSIPPQ
jgi:hypothetical protein